MRKDCAVVPAYQAAETLGAVVADLRGALDLPIVVVDDGSTDGTADVARSLGVELVRHRRNRGKGAALASGLAEAARRGFDAAVTVDADGQHPGRSARAVLDGSDDGHALVLGVRDLASDGAPESNRFGNAVSNFFLSLFARQPLRDTQCGLRRYPIRETLALGARAQGYAFEAEVILRALAAGIPLVEVPVAVVYAAETLQRTHFHNVRDPARIVATVARTVLELRFGAPEGDGHPSAVTVGDAVQTQGSPCARGARVGAPRGLGPRGPWNARARHAARAARSGVPAPSAGSSEVRVVDGLREVFLHGSPEAIGSSQARALRDRMIADESLLWGDYEHFVPWWIARFGIEEVSRVRYRNLDRGIPEARRRELAAQSLAFAPDPFEGRMPTYQRMVFLHALYEIALSFEHSPLIGCSAFALGPEVTRDGHVLAARAFDMETDEVLDVGQGGLLRARRRGDSLRERGVARIRRRRDGAERGRRVRRRAWGAGRHAARRRDAGGVLAARAAVARARRRMRPSPSCRARTRWFRTSSSWRMRGGRFAVVERAPGTPAFVRWLGQRAAVTNQFEGPLAADPKNVRVGATTSSVARADRLEELLGATADGSATPHMALDVLRDHGCARGLSCELGDRRSIDALIATHGVVADLTDRTLWVGVGPHLSGRFVAVDLRAAFAEASVAHAPPEDDMPEDPILHDGRYERAMQARASGGAR